MKNFLLILGSVIIGILAYYIFQGNFNLLGEENDEHPIQVEKRIIDLKQIPVDKKAVGVFKLINTTSEDIQIAGTKSDCGCTVANLDSDYFPGKSETELQVRITKNYPGYFEQTASVHFKDENIPAVLLIVRGEFVEKLASNEAN